MPTLDPEAQWGQGGYLALSINSIYAAVVHALDFSIIRVNGNFTSVVTAQFCRWLVEQETRPSIQVNITVYCQCGSEHSWFHVISKLFHNADFSFCIYMYSHILVFVIL